jgi:predicted nucleic acid-binding protein
MARLRRNDVLSAYARLREAPVRAVAVNDALLSKAWQISDQCGLARIYDAAYVALARMERATLVTLDARLKQSPAARIATIVGPTDLA